jgi:RNA polymerase sigma-70 factor (ECF subfamily)
LETTPISLLERLRANPTEENWNRLVEIYTPLIKGELSQSRIPQEDIDDLSQEIFVVLLRELPHFVHSGRNGAFRHWLRELVVHRKLMYWRAPRRGTVVVDPQFLSDLENPEGELNQRWDRDHDAYVVERLLTLLRSEFTETTWRAFCMQALEHRPPTEVALELGLTINAVVIAKSRVLRRLRQEAQGLID